MDLTKVRTTVLAIALTIASLLVVVLASQKRDLLARIEGLTTRIRDPYVGMYVPAVTLPSVNGDTVLLGQAQAGHVQVLFVFSTRCRYCKASLPAWKQIARELSGNSQVAVVGISVDSVHATRQYVEEHGLEFPVVNFTEPKLQVLYRTVVSPESIVLDGDGVVQYLWLGAVTESATIDSIIQMSRSVGAMADAAC